MVLIDIVYHFVGLEAGIFFDKEWVTDNGGLDQATLHTAKIVFKSSLDLDLYQPLDIELFQFFQNQRKDKDIQDVATMFKGRGVLNFFLPEGQMTYVGGGFARWAWRVAGNQAQKDKCITYICKLINTYIN